MKTLKEIANYDKIYSVHKLFRDKLEPIENHLESHYNYNDENPNAKHYNEDEKEALYNYTADSTHINNYLWRKYKSRNTIDNNYDHESHIKSIDSALAKHKTPKGFNVWSGTIHNPEEIKDKNNIVHHPAYLSTTLNHPNAFGFADFRNPDEGYKHILKIHVPKDHPGLFVGGGEHEFILPRGTNLKHKFTKNIETIIPPNVKFRPGKKLKFKIHHMDIVK